MSLTSLTLLKQQVRADTFGDDDDLLQHYLDAAEEYAVTYTRRSPDDLAVGEDGRLPATVTQAVLLLASHWYNQREASVQGGMSDVPFGVAALLKPWRVFA